MAIEGCLSYGRVLPVLLVLSKLSDIVVEVTVIFLGGDTVII